MRLNRFISQSGICSRRNADLLIQEGHVEVNGDLVTELGVVIDPATDKVLINGKPIKAQGHRYYALNKPKNTVCSTSQQNQERLVTDLIPDDVKVFPVGRLDKDTTGLIILTNDGEWAQKLIHPSSHVEKEYQVTAAWKNTENSQSLEWISNQLAKGIHLGDGRAYGILTKGSYTKDGSVAFNVTVQEGRHHLVRRICSVLGLRVTHLHRVRIGRLTLNRIPLGSFRELTTEEVSKPV